MNEYITLMLRRELNYCSTLDSALRYALEETKGKSASRIMDMYCPHFSVDSYCRHDCRRCWGVATDKIKQEMAELSLGGMQHD